MIDFSLEDGFWWGQGVVFRKEKLNIKKSTFIQGAGWAWHLNEEVSEVVGVRGKDYVEFGIGFDLIDILDDSWRWGDHLYFLIYACEIFISSVDNLVE